MFVLRWLDRSRRVIFGSEFRFWPCLGGERLTYPLHPAVGNLVGAAVGSLVGATVGAKVGESVGVAVGTRLGWPVGSGSSHVTPVSVTDPTACAPHENTSSMYRRWIGCPGSVLNWLESTAFSSWWPSAIASLLLTRKVVW